MNIPYYFIYAALLILLNESVRWSVFFLLVLVLQGRLFRHDRHHLWLRSSSLFYLLHPLLVSLSWPPSFHRLVQDLYFNNFLSTTLLIYGTYIPCILNSPPSHLCSLFPLVPSSPVLPPLHQPLLWCLYWYALFFFSHSLEDIKRSSLFFSTLVYLLVSFILTLFYHYSFPLFTVSTYIFVFSLLYTNNKTYGPL